MKKLGFVAASVAALMTVATPALAASSAAKLSLGGNVQRTGATTQDDSKLAGTSLILAGLAAVAVIAGIVVIADDDDDKSVSN
ncbi:hypothetical protein SAMN06295912_11420 [Sphingomonas laterariae]|uniref:Uncharacterized protein n=2 Tax=Edaphosphingomonas laterariae TaxID=861865 RepID=A0A239GW87_9SPHN|nr:hypothetical protein SAMN06295912_11420 [Sphingomonas laterariae]